MELQKQIEKRISDLGYKKSFVAKKHGIGLSMFSMFLKGKRNLDPDKINRLKGFLGID